MTHLRKILFVDDDPRLLDELRQGLDSMKSEWVMEFVSSGREALECLARSRFDVVVTDMGMPEMSGAELLEQVRTHYPQVIRMVLSGPSDREAVLRTIVPAHQCLTKPCTIDELRQKLSAALALKRLLSSLVLRDVVSRIKTLPSTPDLYYRLLQKLESECLVDEIGKIVELDIAMTSKILQLVNSPIFGLAKRISSPAQAVALLGTETIRSLVLSIGVFSQFRFDRASQREADWLWQHSVVVSRLARKIAQVAGLDALTVDECFTAGLLHDVGKLVLMTECPAEWKEVANVVERAKCDVWSAEHAVLGCTHAQIGAYLLGTWGLPSAIVEAVAWHNDPSNSPATHFSPIAAVHLADFYHSSSEPFSVYEQPIMDTFFLSRCGFDQQEAQCRESCEKLMRNMN